MKILEAHEIAQLSDTPIVPRVYVPSFVTFHLVVCYLDVHRPRILEFMTFICMAYHFIYITLRKPFNTDLFVEFKHTIFHSITILLTMINVWTK